MLHRRVVIAILPTATMKSPTGHGRRNALNWRGQWSVGADAGGPALGVMLVAYDGPFPAAWLSAKLSPTLGLHVITVAGLGTLSLNVMGRTWLLHARRNPASSVMLAAGSALVGLATGLRIAAIALPLFTLSQCAATAWSAAFTVILSGLLRVEYCRRST